MTVSLVGVTIVGYSKNCDSFVSRSFLSCIELRGIGPPGPRADPRSRLVRPTSFSITVVVGRAQQVFCRIRCFGGGLCSAPTNAQMATKKQIYRVWVCVLFVWLFPCKTGPLRWILFLSARTCGAIVSPSLTVEGITRIDPLSVSPSLSQSRCANHGWLQSNVNSQAWVKELWYRQRDERTDQPTMVDRFWLSRGSLSFVVFVDAAVCCWIHVVDSAVGAAPCGDSWQTPLQFRCDAPMQMNVSHLLFCSRSWLSACLYLRLC